ncbi:hypothetical protein EDB83DRAFT_2679768 [Lactarius deliciosus]|nr:hypothetical protein EDB83DRAFT_2679768 [Lactarius deliciosus]
MARNAEAAAKPPRKMRPKEQSAKPRSIEGAPHPFARNGGATGIPPAPPSFTREQDTCTRDKPPPPQPPLAFARKGGEAQELGAARDRTRDAGRRGGRHAHRPFPLLTGDPARNARGGATAPSPGLRAEATRKRGARENGRAPHTLCAPPPFARGQRVNGAREPERAEAAPLPGGVLSLSAAPPPFPASPQGRTRTGGHAEATPPPPFPGFARQGETEKRARAAVRNPPPSRGFAHKGERERAATQKRPPPPSPGFARQGEMPLGSPPPPLYALRGRAGRA